MRQAYLVATFLAFATAAQAQQAQPPFVPYTITEQEHQAILNALSPIPFAQAAPIVQFFVQAEQKAAMAEAAKKRAEDKAAAPKPGPAQ